MLRALCPGGSCGMFRRLQLPDQGYPCPTETLRQNETFDGRLLTPRSITSSSSAALRAARAWTSLIVVSMRSGPFSSLTSSAFFKRLGGSPIGWSRASRAEGRFRVSRVLEQKHTWRESSKRVSCPRGRAYVPRDSIVQTPHPIRDFFGDPILPSIIVYLYVKCHY